MSNLYLQLDAGLGDNIICAGLLCYLQTKHQVTIRIPPRQEFNRVSYESFFAGTGIKIIQPEEIPEETTPLIRQEQKIIPGKQVPVLNHQWIALESTPTKTKPYPIGFYQMFEEKYDIRMKYCPLRNNSFKVKQEPVMLKHYMFIHEDKKRGFEIDERKYNNGSLGRFYMNLQSNNSVLAYREIIENAEEIHCIDSSFFHLVNSFKPKGKLFYHTYAARPDAPKFLMHPEWIRVK